MYQWLAKSDITHFMMGPPRFPDVDVPTWEEFRDDYTLDYFTSPSPKGGGCFIIHADSRRVGQINYNAFDVSKGLVELDIWLSGADVVGKGYGSDALLTLCGHLKERHGCHTFVVGPSARNPEAIRAYQRMGFKKMAEVPSALRPDYYDTVWLGLRLSDNV